METMETNYLNLLPLELKLHLIKYCDGIGLLGLSTLSEEWKELIFKSSKEKWFKICENVIPSDFIIDIILSLTPRLVFGREVIWSDVFISWNKWRNPPEEFTLFKRELCKTRYEITSVKISGSWGFIGTMEGQLSAVHVFSGSHSLISNHGPIYDMELRCTTDTGIVGELWECEHDEVILRSKTHYRKFDLRSGEDLLKLYGRLEDLLQLKYCGQQEVEIYNVHHKTEIKSRRYSKDGSVKVKEKTIYDKLSSVLQVWGDGILLMFDDGSLQVFDFDLNPMEADINKVTLKPEDPTNKKLFVAHLEVLFFLDFHTSYKKELEVIVGQKRRVYRTLDAFNVHITALLYHAGVLFLGLGDGHLFIYLVDSDEELLTLDLSTPRHKLDVTGDRLTAIVSLHIQEDIVSHFLLLAATPNRLYLISTDHEITYE